MNHTLSVHTRSKPNRIKIIMIKIHDPPLFINTLQVLPRSVHTPLELYLHNAFATIAGSIGTGQFENDPDELTDDKHRLYNLLI